MKVFSTCILTVALMLIASVADAGVRWQADSATVIANSSGGAWIFQIFSGGTIVAVCNDEQLKTGSCEEAMEGFHDFSGRMPNADEDVISPNVGVVEHVLPAGTFAGEGGDGGGDQDPPTDQDPLVELGGEKNPCIVATFVAFISTPLRWLESEVNQFHYLKFSKCAQTPQPDQLPPS